ncbi:hypothetical protein NPIL_649641, partial [Nephila pilipes]
VCHKDDNLKSILIDCQRNCKVNCKKLIYRYEIIDRAIGTFP